MKKKVGLYGGTFDPIHLGHLNLAVELMEKSLLDEVLFCPAYRSPLKESPIAAPKDRLAMVRLAIKGFKGFSVTDIEIGRGNVSYTIDTVRSLISSSIELYLLLGAEAALNFDKWKECDQILKLATPLVGNRVLADTSLKVIPTKVMEISSTEIRSRLAKGLPCGHLVPRAVLDYIHLNKLY